MPMTTVGPARVFAMGWVLIPVDHTGERVQAAAKESGIDIEVVKRSDEAKGFVVQPAGGAHHHPAGEGGGAGARPGRGAGGGGVRLVWPGAAGHHAGGRRVRPLQGGDRGPHQQRAPGARRARGRRGRRRTRWRRRRSRERTRQETSTTRAWRSPRKRCWPTRRRWEHQRFFCQFEVAPESLHPDIHERYFFPPGPLKLTVGFHPTGELAEVFRFAGRVMFKGLRRKGGMGVWEWWTSTAWAGSSHGTTPRSGSGPTAPGLITAAAGRSASGPSCRPCRPWTGP